MIGMNSEKSSLIGGNPDSVGTSAFHHVFNGEKKYVFFSLFHGEAPFLRNIGK